MTYRSIFDAKISDTPFSAVFSFAIDLAIGETLGTASVTAAVYSGTDASPSAIISGSASISGGEVTQIIENGVEGVVYILVCLVTTSAGETLTRTGYLAIAPATV
jgi:hypothetical protein